MFRNCYSSTPSSVFGHPKVDCLRGEVYILVWMPIILSMQTYFPPPEGSILERYSPYNASRSVWRGKACIAQDTSSKVHLKQHL